MIKPPTIIRTIIDLEHNIAKLTSHHQGAHITIDIFAPSTMDEHYGYEPPAHIQIYGREVIKRLADSILKFLEVIDDKDKSSS